MSRQRQGPHRANKAKRGTGDRGLQIFGLHAVEAVLKNPVREIVELWLTPNAAQKLHVAAAKRGLHFREVAPKTLDGRLGSAAVHQGALAIVKPLPAPSLKSLRQIPPLVILDQVTDPHNVGAILRSAAAFGASAVIMTKRNSPELSGVLAKAASGALEHVPVLLATNLVRTLNELGKQGYEILGLDGDAETALEDLGFEQPTALVFGAEGQGLRRLTREHCDRLVKILTPGPLASLNVSNAVAVTLHTAATANRRGEPRRPAKDI